eukprot:4180562-Amphidinium_carterae.1
MTRRLISSGSTLKQACCAYSQQKNHPKDRPKITTARSPGSHKDVILTGWPAQQIHSTQHQVN